MIRTFLTKLVPGKLALAMLWVGFLAPALADEVQLVNGDVLSAAVVSLDAKQLKLKSELLGELTIDRTKVRQITLGERLPAKAAAAAAGEPALPLQRAPLSLEDLLKSFQQAGGAAAITPEAALKQLEAAGGDKGIIAELKKNMPLLASPEVQAYFRNQVGGLLDGSLKIDDIRQEAIRARDETKAVLKELGPEAEAAVAPYLGILDKFISETAPPSKAPVESQKRTK